MIKRFYDDLNKLIKPGRALIIYGPRRVGKTTLLRNFLDKTGFNYKLDSGDNIKVQNILSSRDFSLILSYVEGYNLFAIDEAQQILNVGAGLKIIVDQAPSVRVIATGSSSFELSSQVGEPLTGRKQTIVLYPVSQLELAESLNRFELKERLEEYLIFGSYPEVITSKAKVDKIAVIKEIVNSYLLKDILSFDRVRSSQTLLNLLKLLAFQIGSEVSLNELSLQLAIDIKTVSRYLDLLEKAFVIVSIGGFSRNLRSEIKNKRKYYFLDNGVRNGVISQFNSLADRNDTGQLFENFVVTERIKTQSYKKILRTNYFWRTYEQAEIDWVEEGEGKINGYEIKWSVKKSVRSPKQWHAAYKNADFKVITLENYLDFLL